MADVVVIVSHVVASASLSEAWASGDTCWGVNWSRDFIERNTSKNTRAYLIDVVNCRSCD